jgi:hypothetical protein
MNKWFFIENKARCCKISAICPSSRKNATCYIEKPIDGMNGFIRTTDKQSALFQFQDVKTNETFFETTDIICYWDSEIECLDGMIKKYKEHLSVTWVLSDSGKDILTACVIQKRMLNLNNAIEYRI